MKKDMKAIATELKGAEEQLKQVEVLINAMQKDLKPYDLKYHLCGEARQWIGSIRGNLKSIEENINRD